MNSAHVYDENPYYASEESRYQFAPPICRPIDYIAYHPWSELWHPDRRDTWFKAKEIPEARFKAQDLNNHQRGLLGGSADEQHYAPPAIVFQSDQDPTWTREAVESGEIASNQVNLEDLQLSIFDAADAANHRQSWGPGLPREIDWATDEENDASRSPISKITTTRRIKHESNLVHHLEPTSTESERKRISCRTVNGNTAPRNLERLDSFHRHLRS